MGTRRGRTVLVRVETDRMGSVIVTPENKSLRAAMRKHMKANSGHAAHDLYFQGDAGDEFLEDCSPAQRRAVRQGYSVTMRMDPWTLLTMFGYDAAQAVRQDSSGKWHWAEHWSDYPKSAR